MYDFENKLYSLIDAALREDVGDGDHSTLCCIPADAKGKAVLKIKQDGVMAGLDIAEKIFKYKKQKAFYNKYKNDGDEMHAGETAFEVETYRSYYFAMRTTCAEHYATYEWYSYSHKKIQR
jgi:nicotinate-nucleotide pyrophosphorylase (carboxylating)